MIEIHKRHRRCCAHGTYPASHSSGRASRGRGLTDKRPRGVVIDAVIREYRISRNWLATHAQPGSFRVFVVAGDGAMLDVVDGAFDTAAELLQRFTPGDRLSAA